MLKEEKALQQKISACLVIYNEEQVLDRCLGSIKNVVNEIVIVHDGKCTDKSLQIAKKYNAKIFVRKHVGEAEYHRPFAFSKATGDWILHIDADEYLRRELKKEIPKLVKSDEFDAYACNWLVWVQKNSEYISRGPYSRVLRTILFRKNKLYMLGLTHFHPRTKGIISKRMDLSIGHKPSKSVFDRAEYYRKIHRWSKIHRDQINDLGSLPFFGSFEEREKLLSTLKWEINNSCKALVMALGKRLFWFIRNGILFAGLQNYRYLYLDLSYVYYKYLYLCRK